MFLKNFKHHLRSLGAWSWAVSEYREEGILARMDSPEAEEVAYLQDPLGKCWVAMFKLQLIMLVW